MNEIDSSTIFTHSVFLSGEIHGTKSNFDCAIHLVKLLKHHCNLKYVLCELPFSFSLIINDYLRNGDEKLLSSLFSHSDVNLPCEYIDYFKDIYLLNCSVPKEHRITVLGLDIEYLPSISLNYLKNMLPDNSQLKISKSNHTLKPKEAVFKKVDEIKETLVKNPVLFKNLLGSNYDNFSFLIDNTLNSRKLLSFKLSQLSSYNALRENMLYNNFLRLTQNHINEKYFGQFGFNHILLNEHNKIESFACLLNTKNSLYKGKILSIAYNYKNCSFNYRIRGSIKSITDINHGFDSILNHNIQSNIPFTIIDAQKYTDSKNLFSPLMCRTFPLPLEDYFQFIAIIFGSSACIFK